MVNYSFDWFISIIKKNRDINQSVLELVSDGRTLTGGMAMDLGLIDGIGTEKEALKYLETNYPDFKGLPIIDIETPSKKFFLNEIINRISIDSLKFVPEYTNSLKLLSLVR